MSSWKRLKANRRNAQKSTGPRTLEGKQIVSQNARTHGIFSRHAVLPGEENPAEYQELLDEFTAEWRPATVTERALVAEMVNAQWKLARLRRMEQAVHTLAMEEVCAEQWGPHPPPADPETADQINSRFLGELLIRDNKLDQHLAYLARLEAHVRRAFYRAKRELERTQALRAPEMPPEPEPQPQPAYSDRHNTVSPIRPTVPPEPETSS